VGITDGLAALDMDAEDKGDRESYFPLSLLDTAIEFQCMEGKASVEEDAIRIKAEIGDNNSVLDATVHGVMAASALKQVLEEGGERRERYLEAVRAGHVRKLQLNLQGSEADTEQSVAAVVDALDAESLRELGMSTKTSTSLPERVWNLAALTTLDLGYCEGLTSLSDRLGDLASLTTLKLSYCTGLTSLSDRVGDLAALTTLDLSGCEGLASLPERLGDLAALTTLNMSRCKGLATVPDLANLKSRGCKIFEPDDGSDDDY